MSAIDAVVGGGTNNDVFSDIGTAAFTGAGFANLALHHDGQQNWCGVFFAVGL